jgi:hypothetical protein
MTDVRRSDDDLILRIPTRELFRLRAQNHVAVESVIMCQRLPNVACLSPKSCRSPHRFCIKGDITKRGAKPIQSAKWLIDFLRISSLRSS